MPNNDDVIREKITQKVLEFIREIDGISTIRRTQPTMKEVEGFYSHDFPAVAVTDRGFTTSHLRKSPSPHVVRKDTVLAIGVTIYVEYGSESEQLLNTLSNKIVTALETRQGLVEEEDEESGDTGDYKDLEPPISKTVSCVSGNRAPFPPVFAEVLEFNIVYHHNVDKM